MIPQSIAEHLLFLKPLVKWCLTKKKAIPEGTAVIENGEKETGITIHHVTEEYDSGAIIAQAKVPVLEGDTPEVLAARVLEREHTFLVEVLGEITNK
jgi:folate-dependent phosphoribosylglycinamide formyltransferase PurN